MSRTENIAVTCPNCNKKSEFEMWSSINTVLDPHMKAAVRDRTAFLFNCPNCGEKTYVDYGFLYHQMEDKIMIQYANTDENAEEIYNIFKGNDLPEMMRDFMNDDYLIRIVRSQNQLREKLSIIDAGLDDRIIEIIKIMILAQYQNDNPEIKGDIETYYVCDEDKILIQIIAEGENKGFAEIPLDFYNVIDKEFSPIMPNIRKDEPFIDRQWAAKMISEKSKRK